MSRPTKYVKGPAIESMNDLDDTLRAGGWVYMEQGLHLKVYHPGWVISMQFRSLSDLVGKGRLFYALERASIEEEPVPA